MVSVIANAIKKTMKKCCLPLLFVAGRCQLKKQKALISQGFHGVYCLQLLVSA
jgi:5-formaminoimidazole-4-carboxamide-1-beta-D-ribofuranosyl 5'-monophosphate synthetase